MLFDDSDLNTILDATGEDVTVLLSGVIVKTIQGKFRKNFETVSPFESNVGMLHPVVTVKTSDLVGITTSHSFLIRGTEYKYDSKPEEQPSGFSIVKLGLKK